jgi:hypothetical protein
VPSVATANEHLPLVRIFTNTQASEQKKCGNLDSTSLQGGKPALRWRRKVTVCALISAAVRRLFG